MVRIQLQKTATSYQIRSGLLNDAGAWTDTSWYNINNSWSAVEIHYQAFANSGSLTLWLDDAQKQSLTFIDNDTRTVTDVRLGAQGIETGTRGTIYFDDFESRRFSYIGTLTDPGVNDPQATNAAGWTASTYQYSASIPHAVTSVAIENGGTNTYSYDANGNMTCRIENGVTYTHTYNAENRASSIAKRSGDCATGTILESWSFVYDGDGVRVGTVHFTGTSGTPDSTTSYYMGGGYEVKDGATKKYYSIAGMMVAVKEGSEVQYLLTDHLGSTVAVTDDDGTLTYQQRYLPFGAPRAIPNSPIAGTDFTYTGQRMLDSGMGGIMDYKARFYSPYLNRFLQPDRIIPNLRNPQSWNRFSYVLNNPIRFSDPTGHEPKGPGSCYDSIVGVCVSTKIFAEDWKKIISKGFGITISDEDKDWDARNLELVYSSLQNIDNTLNGQLKSLVEGSTFKLSEYFPTPENCPYGGCTYSGWTSGTTITFYTMGNAAIRQMNIYHEFGHLLNNSPGMINAFSGALDNLANPSFVLIGGDRAGQLDLSALVSASVYDPNYGIADALQHPSTDPNEQWADIFANLVAGNIDLSKPAGPGTDMYDFVTGALAPHIGVP